MATPSYRAAAPVATVPPTRQARQAALITFVALNGLGRMWIDDRTYAAMRERGLSAGQARAAIGELADAGRLRVSHACGGRFHVELIAPPVDRRGRHDRSPVTPSAGRPVAHV